MAKLVYYKDEAGYKNTNGKDVLESIGFSISGNYTSSIGALSWSSGSSITLDSSRVDPTIAAIKFKDKTHQSVFLWERSNDINNSQSVSGYTGVISSTYTKLIWIGDQSGSLYDTIITLPTTFSNVVDKVIITPTPNNINKNNLTLTLTYSYKPSSITATYNGTINTIFFHEVSFAMDISNIYKWKGDKDELNSGLGFSLTDAPTRLVKDDVYWINTENFKIRDANIGVYGKSGADHTDDGNYRYDYSFNYGYDKPTEPANANYYAWGKNQVSYVLLYSNIGKQGAIPTITVTDTDVIIGGQTYKKPSNTKIVVCKRSAGAITTTKEPIYISDGGKPGYTLIARTGFFAEALAKIEPYRINTKETPQAWNFCEYKITPNYYISEVDNKTSCLLNDLSYGESNPERWQNLGFKVEKYEFNYEAKPEHKTSRLPNGFGIAIANVITKQGLHNDVGWYCRPGSINFMTFRLYNHILTPTPIQSFIEVNEQSNAYTFIDRDHNELFAYASKTFNVSSSVFGLLPKKSWSLIENAEKKEIIINNVSYPYYLKEEATESSWSYIASIYAAVEFNETEDAYWVFAVPQDFSLS